MGERLCQVQPQRSAGNNGSVSQPDHTGLVQLDAQGRVLQTNLKGREHLALSQEKPSSPVRSTVFHWPPASPLTSNRL